MIADPTMRYARPDPPMQHAARRGTFRDYLRGHPVVPDQDVPLMANLSPAEVRALSTLSDAAGGFLIDSDMQSKVYRALNIADPIRRLATVIETAAGGDAPTPGIDDTGNEGGITAENATLTELDLAVVALNAPTFMFDSRVIRAPIQWVHDIKTDVESFLADTLGARIGRGQGRVFTSGAGPDEPKGVVASAALGVSGSAATAVTWNELIDLEASVDPAYRDNPNSVFMGSSNTRVGLLKLTDGSGRPLVLTGPQGTFINGKRYVVNPYMSDMATGVRSLLFGDFSQLHHPRRAGRPAADYPPRGSTAT